ncbi:hypothetical protein TNIN_443771 [Trichonephila inaurata madagascariensis]|uniref:Uncharacterized protein n=1 Tax=Trichonephila inaurata madagascariensis TaxID=2747483 RepID=A0A8X6M8B1_9ARAC|nr:hypothetical protein TNIN_443771 [Trichonephila inaurata madagascariensis]
MFPTGGTDNNGYHVMGGRNAPIGVPDEASMERSWGRGLQVSTTFNEITLFHTGRSASWVLRLSHIRKLRGNVLILPLPFTTAQSGSHLLVLQVAFVLIKCKKVIFFMLYR